MSLQIRSYHSDQLDAVIELICQAIYAIDDSLYTEIQKGVWADGIQQNPDAMNDRLTIQKTYLAHENQQVLGVASLRKDGYIDFLYVSPAHQRRGLATILFTRMELEASELGVTLCSTHASYAAVPFFEYVGFKVITENRKVLKEVTLTNFYMEKLLK